MRPVFPNYCYRCFNIKVVNERRDRKHRWIAITADNELRLGDHAAATNIFGYWAGQWGMPGQRPYSYFHTKVPNQPISWSLRAYPNGTLKWGDNAWDFAENAPNLAAKDMMFYAAARDETSGLVPSEALIGACTSPGTFENCTYIGASGDRLSLMPADRALTFQWTCVSCESRPLNGRAAIMIVGLVGLALLPFGLYRTWRSRCSRRKLPPPTQWPVAPRSSLAWLLLFVSWALVILGLTPSVLWYVGHWWASGAGSPLALVAFGATGMQLCLRQDDPLALIRIVSLLHVLVRLTVAWFTIHEVSISYGKLLDRASGDSGDAAEIRDYPLLTPFGRFAVEGVNATGAMVLQLLIVVFCVSQKPLWGPGAKRGKPQPLRWLWFTTRLHFGASAIVLLLMGLASLLIGLFHRASAYPSEIQRSNGLLTLYLTMGTALLVSALVTSETSRLRIHLRHMTWGRGVVVMHSSTASFFNRSLTTEEISPPSLVGAGGIEISVIAEVPITEPAPDASDEATLAASPHEMMADMPWPMAPLGDGVACNASLNGHASPASSPHHIGTGISHVDRSGDLSGWSNVDLSAWSNLDGRFDSLRLLTSIGYGGFASVFVAELDSPILSAGVAAGGATGAGSSAGHSGTFRVAVKVFDQSAYKDAAEVRRLQLELDLAPNLESPYVVHTLGTTLLQGRIPALVMELLAGSLGDLLYARMAVDPPSPVGAAVRQKVAPPMLIAGALKRRLLLEVALGLQFLHSAGISHRDVKPANVLLDSEIHAKISDFGIATRFGMEGLTIGIGTLRYMAPEVLFGPYDERADIFAFGMLVWETLHEAKAFSDINPLAAIVKVQSGVRPPLALHNDLTDLAPLMEMCWSEMPQDRPQGMSVVIEILEACGAVLNDGVVYKFNVVMRGTDDQSKDGSCSSWGLGADV